VASVTGSLKRVPPAPGVGEVLLPGEPEVRTRRQREREGLALPADTWTAIAEVAAKAGVGMPAASRH
jgi:uncharacterized oxidoreductase